MSHCQNIEAQQSYLCMLGGISSSEQNRCPSVLPRQAMQWFAYPLSEIRFDHKVFELCSPLTVHLFQDDGLWYCKDEGEHFLACGNSRERAVHSFSEDFSVYWRVIAEAPDQELDDSAQAVKRFMRSIVKSVKTE